MALMARRKARATDSQSAEKAFQTALSRRFLLRLHMMIILGGTFAAALGTTKLLVWMRVNNLAWRYGIAVTAAFGTFLLFVRAWLAYINVCVNRAQKRSDSDWLSGFNFSSGGGSSVSDAFTGGGGAFGGGGASGGWGDPVAATQLPVVAVPPQAAPVPKSGGFNLGDCVDDDLGLVVLAIVFVAAIAVAAVYLVYAAPMILGEAAFQAALTASLAHHAKNVGHGSWMASVARSTLLPFLAVLALAITVGWYAQKHCPTATRLRDAFACAPR